jgi:stage V sporulation protein B
VLLTRVLGTAGYGALSTALSVSAVVYNPVVQSSIQGVSRTVARADDAERPQVTRRVLTLHAAFALPVALLFAVLAGPIVQWVHAPHLVGPVRILAAVLFFYALYAPLVGVLNGQRRFVWQAGFDMAFATLRTALMLGGAYALSRAAQHGVTGASLGFALATAVIFVAALMLAGTGRKGAARLPVRQYLAFIAPVFMGQILLNLLQQADLTVLRYFAASAALRGGLAPQAADPLVGAYRATQLFCFLPYQLLLSVTFVLFPLLARAHRDGDMANVRLYVMTGVRLALIVAGVMVSVISGLAGPLLRLVFPAEVATYATNAMQLLALGFGAFAIFGILTTVLTSLKAERASAVITGVAFALVAILGVTLLSNRNFGAQLLWITAIATSIGLVIATFAAGALVHKIAGAVAPLGTLVRVSLVAATTIVLGRLWSPSGKLMTVVAAGVLVVVNLILLTITRELTRRDLGYVRSVAQRS